MHAEYALILEHFKSLMQNMHATCALKISKHILSGCQDIFLYRALSMCLKVHKIENFFDSDFGICVISLLVMSKY
jgi:hypothetical protein